MFNNIAIILITYNRKKHLQKTFDQILAETSPIKDFDITILDNASSDGASELIETYCLRYKNIKHIRHNINIGGNANIVRAYEIASNSGKEYVWVLCDDDFYDFSNWNEIEQALSSSKYDIVFMTSYLIRNRKDIAQLTHQATFIPACIYRTNVITDETIQNMYNMINYMFTQSMISAPIICEKLDKVFIPQKSIVLRIPSGEESDKTIIRGRKIQEVHPETKRIFWHIAFINAMQIVKDEKKRNYIIQNVRFTDIFDQSFCDYMYFIITYNNKYKKNNIKNLFELFLNINFLQKCILIYSYMIFLIKCFLKSINFFNVIRWKIYTFIFPKRKEHYNRRIIGLCRQYKKDLFEEQKQFVDSKKISSHVKIFYKKLKYKVTSILIHTPPPPPPPNISGNSI